ncbi:MAG: FAD-dependent monooxygenase [Arenibacterium sp.]
MTGGQEITVLGAGIGGLTAAIALAGQGRRVRVVEQAPVLREVGAGIQLSHNAMVVFAQLGLAERLRAVAVRSEGTLLVNFSDGAPVLPVAPPAAGPTWYVHRADLIALLAEAAAARGVAIELGGKVAALRPEADGTVLQMADGQAQKVDLLVAADGVRGPGRRAMEGTIAPRFSGQVAWRAVVPWTHGVGEARAKLAMGPGRHVVTYPLRDGALMNLVAVEERRGDFAESWSASGDPAELRARFAGFGGEAGAVISQGGEVNLWALSLHPVATQWWRHRLVLLGDAAHPTLPFMAQGACLAIEDAYVLAQALADGAPDALARYQARRITRVRRVVDLAGRNTWRFHLRAPWRQIAHRLLRFAGPRAAPDIDWVYAHDVTRERVDRQP